MGRWVAHWIADWPELTWVSGELTAGTVSAQHNWSYIVEIEWQTSSTVWVEHGVVLQWTTGKDDTVMQQAAARCPGACQQ
jgi:hypothetical protein